MSKAIIVAGGAGYIGSHVCKALHGAGYLPVVLDDFSAGRRDFVRWGPVYEASVADEAVVREIAATHEPRAVIDLAGSIEVGESVRDPLKYYANNAAAKLPFLRTLKDVGVEAFVFSSTAAVYGEPDAVPIPETQRLAPKNPYGWSKLVFEQMLRDFHSAGGPRWTALRYFNAAGASPDGEIGESHDPETHLIPRACLAALGRIPALDIFGKDFPTRDGTCERDYIHVADLASAHVLALASLLEGAAPAVYNLGNGTGTTIGEVLQCFKGLGIDVPHQFGPRRAGDPARLVADATLARQALGWQPQHGSIEAIVTSAYAWHERNIIPQDSVQVA
jgi:UDP-arabinose 4-epimerase